MAIPERKPPNFPIQILSTQGFPEKRSVVFPFRRISCFYYTRPSLKKQALFPAFCKKQEREYECMDSVGKKAENILAEKQKKNLTDKY